MNEKKYASREGSAAYGYGELFKVPSVVIVTATIDAKSKKREQEETMHHKKNGTFEEVFKGECNKAYADQDVLCNTTGYTKDARFFNYNMKVGSYA